MDEAEIEWTQEKDQGHFRFERLGDYLFATTQMQHVHIPIANIKKGIRYQTRYIFANFSGGSKPGRLLGKIAIDHI